MRRQGIVIAIGVAWATIAASSGAGARVSAGPRTVWDSVYSAAQAARGETAYVRWCARCHRESLAGADEAPPLAGSGFVANWNGLTLAALHDRIRTSMPPDTVAGVLTPPTVTDVIAHILKVNAFPAGATELPTDTATLRDVVIQATKP